MNNLYLNIMNDNLYEEGAVDGGGSATTMDAVAYLPTQVGVTKAALNKLKKKKSKWNLEILEEFDEYVLNFENQLKIIVLKEDWEEFQENLGTDLDEDVKVIQFEEDNLNPEDIIESRKEELFSKINEIVESKELLIAEKIARKFFEFFKCKENITETINPLIDLLHLKDWTQQYLDNALLEHEDDLGYIEMLIENFKLTEGNCLAGARYKSVYQGTELIFEVRVTFERDCSFSMVVRDAEIADNLEEYCVGLYRIGNVFFPAAGQILSNQGVLEALKEILEEVVEEKEENTGEENNEK